MFKGPQGMSLAGNAPAAAAAATATAVAAAASAAATAAADKTKMCASSLIFRAIKWCFCLCDLLWGQWKVAKKTWAAAASAAAAAFPAATYAATAPADKTKICALV